MMGFPRLEGQRLLVTGGSQRAGAAIVLDRDVGPCLTKYSEVYRQSLVLPVSVPDRLGSVAATQLLWKGLAFGFLASLVRFGKSTPGFGRQV